MLRRLELPTLEDRRSVARLVLLFKILSGSAEVNCPETLSPLGHSVTRGHDRRLRIISSNTELYKHTFFPATVRSWNRLTQLAVAAETVEAFRAAVTAGVAACT